MAGHNDDGDNPRETDTGPGGLVESDDTTQADAGMTGGSGAEEGGATATPTATEPHADDEDLDD